MSKKLLEVAADIVQAQLGSSAMNPCEVSLALRMTYQTLAEIQRSESSGADLNIPMISEASQDGQPSPKQITPEDSIQNDKVICLECGAEMRQLTVRHLSTHGLSAKEYKRKHGMPLKTTLAAKALTKARSKAAKKRGLPEKLRLFIEERKQAKAGAAEGGKVAAESVKPKQTRTRKAKVS